MAVNISSFLLSTIPFPKCFKVKSALIHMLWKEKEKSHKICHSKMVRHHCNVEENDHYGTFLSSALLTWLPKIHFLKGGGV